MSKDAQRRVAISARCAAATSTAHECQVSLAPTQARSARDIPTRSLSDTQAHRKDHPASASPQRKTPAGPPGGLYATLSPISKLTGALLEANHPSLSRRRQADAISAFHFATPLPTDVRCVSNSDQILRSGEMRRWATSGYPLIAMRCVGYLTYIHPAGLSFARNMSDRCGARCPDLPKVA